MTPIGRSAIMATVLAGLCLHGCSRQAEEPAPQLVEPAAEPTTTEAQAPTPSDEQASADDQPRASEPESEPASSEPEPPKPSAKQEKPGAAKPQPRNDGMVHRATPPEPEPAKAKAAPQTEPRSAKPDAGYTVATTGGDSAAPAKQAPLLVTGQVTVVSKVPEPGTAPYKECVTYVKYKVLSVDSGEYDGSELLAVYWGMRDNKLMPAAKFKVGQKHTMTLVPFSTRAELQRVMAADDTDEYALEPYWVVK